MIELVISVVILGIAVPPLLHVFVEAATDALLPERQTAAYMLAAQKMEEVVADRHAPSRGYDYLVTSNYPAESVLSSFTGFSRTVTFTEVSPSDLTSTQANSGYMRVAVTVSYTAPNGSYVLTCVLCEL